MFFISYSLIKKKKKKNSDYFYQSRTSLGTIFPGNNCTTVYKAADIPRCMRSIVGNKKFFFCCLYFNIKMDTSKINQITKR